MKAAFFDVHGGPEVLRYGDLPDPVVRPGELLVDVQAASVNGADWRVRAGAYRRPVGSFPYVLGRDFSGVVSALGDGVTGFRVGDEVFGVCDVGQEGAYAEKLAIRASLVAPKPASLSHAECAAVALIGLTALVSLEDTLAVRAGESVFVSGGAGGVASFAIPLVRHLGARVASSTSTANREYVRGLGADPVVDYTREDFAAIVNGCDAAFDTVGGEVATRIFAVLRPGGRAAFIASGDTAPEPPRPDVRALRPKVARDRPHLERVAALVAGGAVGVPPLTIYRLADAAEAHRVSEGRHLRGKLVFAVR